MAGKKVRKTPTGPNYKLPGGSMRFSRARVNQIKAIYKIKPSAAVKKPASKQDLYKVKKVGGEKNGSERKVLIQRDPKSLGSQKDIKEKQARNRTVFSEHKRRLRSSLTPGTVVIMLAGIHKGKRAVFLKQLKSGLLLVTGPMRLNNCPMRRIAQSFVIGTKTKLDISKVSIPEHIDDDYFRRQRRQRRTKDADTDIFAQHKQDYVVSDQRKQDQLAVDGEILGVVRSNPEKKFLFGYLGSTWSLKRNEKPHQMVF